MSKTLEDDMEKRAVPRPFRFAGIIISFLLIMLACNLPIPRGAPSAPASTAGPRVLIQQPSNGLEVTQGDTVVFFAAAVDPNGVRRLDLWIDGTAAISQSSPDENGLTTLSLSYPLVAVSPGTYALTARAYNTLGEMGESTIHYVNVIEPTASTQEYAQYIVQNGETLESIAAKFGVSVESILQANPNIGGQVKAGMAILIPQGAQQAAQPAIPNQQGGGQPGGQGQPGGGQAGNPPGNLPGLLPIFQPGGIAGNLPGGVVAVAPNLFPNINAINVLPNFNFAAPGLQVFGNGCQMSLSWTDDTSDELGFNVYRVDPAVVQAELKIAELSPDTTQYQDNVSSPGKYGYVIEAYKTEGGKTRTASSPYVWADAQPSNNCSDTDPMRVFFQPVSFQPSDASLQYGFVNVTINGFSAIRVPRGQQTRIPAGNWNDPANSWAIPLPAAAKVKPGESLTVEIQGNGVTDAKSSVIFLLGNAVASHTFEALTAADSKDKIWEAKADSMTVTYKIWMEEAWGGGSPIDPDMPPPFNLVLSDSGDSRALAWKYDSKAKTDLGVDGFIIYAHYDCPGSIGNVVNSFVVDSDPQSLIMDKSKEPAGCTCKVTARAFSRQQKGYSKLSSLATGDCSTLTAEESVQVVFDRLTVKNLPAPKSASINLNTNEALLQSNRILFENFSYSLGYFSFGGGGNKTVINFSPGESRAIQLGISVPGICNGQWLLGKDSPSWPNSQSHRTTTVDGNCELEFTINPIAPANPPNNAGTPPPSPPAPAGQPQLLGLGELCTEDAACASGSCVNWLCVPKDGTGRRGDFCIANSQCGKGNCQCTAELPNGGFVIVPCGPGSDSGYCDSPGLPYGAACSSDTQPCTNWNCDGGVCAPPKGLGQVGEYCHSDDQCGNNFCFCPSGYDGKYCKNYANLPPSEQGRCIAFPGKVNGSFCDQNDECASRHCAENACVPIDGTGLEGEYCRHDNHCWSGACECVSGKKDIFGVCIQSDPSQLDDYGSCVSVRP